MFGPQLITIALPRYEADRAPWVRGLRKHLRQGKISDLEFWYEDGVWFAQWYD